MNLMSIVRAPEGSDIEYYRTKMRPKEVAKRAKSADLLRFLMCIDSGVVAEAFCRRGSTSDMRMYLHWKRKFFAKVRKEFLRRAPGSELVLYYLFGDYTDTEVYDLILDRASPLDCINYLKEMSDSYIFDTFLERAYPMDCIRYLKEIGKNEEVEDLLFRLVPKEDREMYEKMVESISEE